jgi:hypothetical protein
LLPLMLPPAIAAFIAIIDISFRQLAATLLLMLMSAAAFAMLLLPLFSPYCHDAMPLFSRFATIFRRCRFRLIISR